MTKYIKGKDGRFKGSLPDPTRIPTLGLASRIPELPSGTKIKPLRDTAKPFNGSTQLEHSSKGVYDYYSLVGVDPLAESDSVIAAIKSKRAAAFSNTTHPSLKVRQEAEKQMSKLAEAEAILLSGMARRKYDQAIQRSGFSQAEELQVQDINYHELIGVSENATRAEISEALDSQRKKWSKRQGASNSEQRHLAEEKMAQLKAAAEKLLR